jgi:hypothetical protein
MTWVMICTPKDYYVADASAPDVVLPEGYYLFQHTQKGLEGARLVMSTYDWCRRHLGPARLPGDDLFEWLFKDHDLLIIRRHHQAIEFRVRWC